MDETARQLGSLDARVGNIETDVKEIKQNVNTLVLAQNASTAVRSAADSGLRKYLVPFVALGASLVALFRGG